MVNKSETFSPRLMELAHFPTEFFQTGDRDWGLEERVKFASDLFDFLTCGGETSFVHTCGEKKILWEAGYWNVGTDAQPILWGLEGVGDHRGVNFEVYIPVTLAHRLDEMYHGESSEEIMAWHQNLIETVGLEKSCSYIAVSQGGEQPKTRYRGTQLSMAEFVQFVTFGSGARLITMARQIAVSLNLSGALASIHQALDDAMTFLEESN